MGTTTAHDSLAALRSMLDDEPAQPLTPLDADACEALTDDHVVCTCNNVTAGEIRTAISTGACTTLDDVQVCTRAGGACGGCLPAVAGLVDVEIGRSGTC